MTIPKDYKHLKKTFDGYDVDSLYQDKYGHLVAIVRRSNPYGTIYGIAYGYDPCTGDWMFGHYSNRTPEAAVNEAYQRYGDLTEFDPNNPKDVDFEMNAKYNRNHVGENYLSTHNHRDDDFDTYYSSDYVLDEENPTREGYDKVRREHRKVNSPWRSEAVKGHKSAQSKRKPTKAVRSKKCSKGRC